MFLNVVLNGSSVGTRPRAKLNCVPHRAQGRMEANGTFSLSSHCSLKHRHGQDTQQPFHAKEFQKFHSTGVAELL